MKTNHEPQIKAAIDACYELASKLNTLAAQACETRDTNMVHWFVTEERRIANLARTIERRVG